MSFLASLGGQLLGNVLGKWSSSAIDSHYSKQLIEAQLKAQKDLFEFENSNKHQFEVGDLRAAGLNPILSATNPSAIGVGGVSAPNWSSDDDIFSPASAKALQMEQLGIQEKQAIAAEKNAEAALIQAENGRISSSAKASLDNMSAHVMWEKLGLEKQSLFKGIEEADARIKKFHGEFDKILSEIGVNNANAKYLLEKTVGENLSNREFKGFVKMVEDLEKDPGMQGTATLNSLRVAKHLPYLGRAERMGLIASLTDWSLNKKGHNNDSTSSSKGLDIYNNYDQLYEYGGVRE